MNHNVKSVKYKWFKLMFYLYLFVRAIGDFVFPNQIGYPLWAQNTFSKSPKIAIIIFSILAFCEKTIY